MNHIYTNLKLSAEEFQQIYEIITANSKYTFLKPGEYFYISFPVTPVFYDALIPTSCTLQKLKNVLKNLGLDVNGVSLSYSYWDPEKKETISCETIKF